MNWQRASTTAEAKGVDLEKSKELVRDGPTRSAR